MRNAHAPRSALQAVRLRAELLQEEVAGHLEFLAASMGKPRVITAQRVCDWEAGRRLTLDAVTLLCAYWQRSAEALGLLPNFAIGDHDRSAESSDRRLFMGHIAALTVAGSVSASNRWTPMGQEPRCLPNRVELADVVEMEAFTQTMRNLDSVFGGGACCEALDAQVNTARRLLRIPVRDTLRPRLLIAVADLHNLAGWTALDCGLGNVVRSHLLQALQLAKEADDQSLAANVLYRAGRLHLHRGWPDEALRLFRLGMIAAHDSGSSTSVAVLSANQSWAYAALGKSADALAALRRAEEVFVHHDEADLPSWNRFFGPGELAAMTGAVHTELSAADPRHAEPAIVALSEALSRRDDDMNRCKAFDLAMLATNHFRLGDVDLGIGYADKLIDLAPQLSSARVVDRLRPLRYALARHRHRTDVRELDARIAGLTS